MSKDAGAEEAALLKDTAETVLVQSVVMPPESVIVKGYDFNNGVDHNALLDSFLTSGFQVDLQD
jgi:deoxyhypusine synthase